MSIYQHRENASSNPSSGRIIELISRHEAATAEIADLSRLCEHYDEQARDAEARQNDPRPPMVACVEEYTAEVRQRSEIAATSHRQATEARQRMASLTHDSRTILATLADEGMPESVWVCIGGDEYALLEYENLSPKLRRAPGKAITLAADRTTPAEIEANAAEITSRLRRLTPFLVALSLTLMGMGFFVLVSWSFVVWLIPFVMASTSEIFAVVLSVVVLTLLIIVLASLDNS